MTKCKKTGVGSKCTFSKVGCAVPMVISSNFRMVKHRDDDYEEDAPCFTFQYMFSWNQLDYI